MAKLLTIGTLALTLNGACSSSWVEFRPVVDGFTVELPRVPEQVAGKDSPIPFGTAWTLYSVRSGPGPFWNPEPLVGYMLWCGERKSEEGVTKILDAALASALGLSKDSRLISRRSTRGEVAVTEDVLVEAENESRVRQRTIVGERRIYILTVIGDEQTVSSEALGGRFIGSFKALR